MSEFVKHPRCKADGCQETDISPACGAACRWLSAYEEETRCHFFETRDTDQESRLDRKARARECK